MVTDALHCEHDRAIRMEFLEWHIGVRIQGRTFWLRWRLDRERTFGGGRNIPRQRALLPASGSATKS